MSIEGGNKMSNKPTLLKKCTSNENPDYKKLYFSALNALTDIHEFIVNVQRHLEEAYLKQTEPCKNEPSNT